MCQSVELKDDYGKTFFKYRRPILNGLFDAVGEYIYLVDSNVIRGASKQKGPDKYTLDELHARGAVSVPGDVIVELCTCIGSEKEFRVRKATAEKIGAANLFLLPQSGVYLRWLYGLIGFNELTDDLDKWASNLAYLGQMASFEEWKSDKSFQELSRERTEGYQVWVEEHMKEFQKIAEISREGNYKDLTGKPQMDREKILSMDDYPMINIRNLEYRVTNGDASLVSAERRAFAESHLRNYGKMIHQYQKKVYLHDGGTVEKNDRGDIDIIMFVSPSSPLFPGRQALLVTRDANWLKLVNMTYPVKMAFDPLELVENIKR